MSGVLFISTLRKTSFFDNWEKVLGLWTYMRDGWPSRHHFTLWRHVRGVTNSYETVHKYSWLYQILFGIRWIITHSNPHLFLLLKLEISIPYNSFKTDIRSIEYFTQYFECAWIAFKALAHHLIFERKFPHYLTFSMKGEVLWNVSLNILNTLARTQSVNYVALPTPSTHHMNSKNKPWTPLTPEDNT